jgi:hypothetical protein
MLGVARGPCVLSLEACLERADLGGEVGEAFLDAVPVLPPGVFVHGGLVGAFEFFE